MQSRLLKAGTLTWSLLLGALCSACSDDNASELVGARSEPIIRGVPSGEDDDHVVELITQVSESNTGLCTGTLIAPDVLVTALHCLAYSEAPGGAFSCKSDGSLMTSIPGAGSFGAPTEAENIQVFLGSTIGSKPDALGRKVFSSGSNQICRNDIAVVVLDREVGSKVAPLRFAPAVEYGDRVTLVGYGATEEPEASGRRRRDGVRIIDVGSTADLQGGRTATINTFVTGEGACHGDSGGPAFAEDTGALVGVYSLSTTTCTANGVRNVYTALAPFRDLVDKGLEFAGREPTLEPSEGSGGARGEGGSGPESGASGDTSVGGSSTMGGQAAGGGSSAAGAFTTGESGGEPSDPDPDPDPDPDGLGSGSRRDPSCACRISGKHTQHAPALAMTSLLGLALMVRRQRR